MTLVTTLLLSPPAVLFQVAVTVSPILYAPPVPEAPEMLMAASVTVGPRAVPLKLSRIVASKSGEVMRISSIVMLPKKNVPQMPAGMFRGAPTSRPSR